MNKITMTLNVDHLIKEAVRIFRRRADEDCTDPAFAGKTGYSAAR